MEQAPFKYAIVKSAQICGLKDDNIVSYITSWKEYTDGFDGGSAYWGNELNF